MKRLQQLREQLHSRAGYAMLMVLCALLLFTVLGSNALLAAQAAAGATTRKQEDTQAYVLATSALRSISEMMEENKFAAHIQSEVFGYTGSFTDDYGNPRYLAPITAELAVPEMPTGMEMPKITVEFTVDGLQKYDLSNGGKGDRVDLLTARVSVSFRSAFYSFLADFYHLADPDNASKSTWKLKGYRDNRDNTYTDTETP